MSVSVGVIVLVGVWIAVGLVVAVWVAVGLVVAVGLGATVCVRRALTVSTTGFVGLIAETGRALAPVGKVQDDKMAANKMVSMRAGPNRLGNCGVLSMTSPIKRQIFPTTNPIDYLSIYSNYRSL
jgi:hypothetical protein